MSRGYYSLVQLCPCFARAEAVNVGVLVFQPEPAAIEVRVLDDLRHLPARLGMTLPLAAVQDAVHAMQRRLLVEGFASLDDLERFVRTRGNDIQLTMPRPMRVGDITTDTEQLFAELVLPRPFRSTASARITDRYSRAQRRSARHKNPPSSSSLRER